MNRVLALALSSALLLAACGGSDEPATTPRTSLGTAQAGTLTTELLAGAPLATGLNQLYVKVTDGSGAAVTNATVSFRPMMDMGTMTHSAPVFSSPMTFADGFYQAGVVFQMASGMSGSWSGTVTVTPSGASPVVASYPTLTIAEAGAAKTFTSGMSRYVVSMNFKSAPRVGLNPVTVTLSETADMGMTFTPVSDATIALDPQMPSMGHGSPGSVNPTPTSAAGFYDGQLSFSMPGAWETTLAVSRGGTAIGSVKIVTSF